MNKCLKKIITLILAAGIFIFSHTGSWAGPKGGRVVAGGANIHQSGNTTTIDQKSNRAIINWRSFDIGKQEAVYHNMPSHNSAGLHRVVGGGGASHIVGQLKSNGNIYLVNPAGVVIHKGARVQTNGFVATSRDISDRNFMKGNMVFDKPGHPDAKIINQGNITVKDSGLAALVAPTVRNDGVIAGKLSKVVLASGNTSYKLDMHGDELITFTVGENDINSLQVIDGSSAKNKGKIKTDGGIVVLTASQFDNIVGSVVNTGVIEADNVTFRGHGGKVDIINTGVVNASSKRKNGGRVMIEGDARVKVGGTILASEKNKGGSIVITGEEIAVIKNTKIDVSGNTGGGKVLIGGNYRGQGPEKNSKKTYIAYKSEIYANAKLSGNGGRVVVWSDGETKFEGKIEAKGGKKMEMVE